MYKYKISLSVICFFLVNIFNGKDINLNYNTDDIKKAIVKQYNLLKIDDKNLINKTKVIILNFKGLDVKINKIDNIILSNIIISPDIVVDPIETFYISHYIRNQLMKSMPVFINKENIEINYYYFNDYNTFITSKSKIICEVIYYLYHEKYYGLIKKLFDRANELLLDKRLEPDRIELIKKLRKEKTLFEMELIVK